MIHTHKHTHTHICMHTACMHAEFLSVQCADTEMAGGQTPEEQERISKILEGIQAYDTRHMHELEQKEVLEVNAWDACTLNLFFLKV